ncbi:MAG: four helix bundle protein [Bacteroidales bacterium]|nr:four helix bundle protein [Bacteroidales bacterium]
MKTQHDPDLWKKAIDMETMLCKMTMDFPQTEIYGLTDQIRRSFISIPSNLAEGAAAALQTQWIIYTHLGFFDRMKFEHVDQMQVEHRKMLSGLSRSIVKRSSRLPNH